MPAGLGYFGLVRLRVLMNNKVPARDRQQPDSAGSKREMLGRELKEADVRLGSAQFALPWIIRVSQIPKMRWPIP